MPFIHYYVQQVVLLCNLPKGHFQEAPMQNMIPHLNGEKWLPLPVLKEERNDFVTGLLSLAICPSRLSRIRQPPFV